MRLVVGKGVVQQTKGDWLVGGGQMGGLVRAYEGLYQASRRSGRGITDQLWRQPLVPATCGSA